MGLVALLQGLLVLLSSHILLMRVFLGLHRSIVRGIVQDLIFLNFLLCKGLVSVFARIHLSYRELGCLLQLDNLQFGSFCGLRDLHFGLMLNYFAFFFLL
jgi:hypothetical protein